MDPEPLRAPLAKALDWEDAHVGIEAAVGAFPADLRGVRPEGLPYSAWELLEHVRLAQRDILDFCRDPAYEQGTWPEDYWPEGPAPPGPDAWDRTLSAVREDREAVKRLVLDPALDLGAEVPHGSGQTYLREVLLVVDHGAYHVGQIVLVRRLLGVWPPGGASERDR